MQKKFILLILFIFVCCSDDKDKTSEVSTTNKVVHFEKLYAESEEAYKINNYKLYKDLCYKILQFSPNHPYLMYNYAKSLALLNENNEAIDWLEKIGNIGGILMLSIESDSSFSSLFNNPEFKKIVKQSRNDLKPINNSTVAFIIGEKDLIPEGVAYNELKNNIYISSIYKRKIIRIDKDGSIINFKQEKQNGLLSVIGIEFDAKRRNLWVCSSWDGNSKILDIESESEENKRTAVFKYNIDSGQLLKKYTLEDTTKRFFNDLTIHSGGDVFITDWYAGEVYIISLQKDELELYSNPSEYLYPNGITLSDDGRFLFVAHLSGIDRIDIEKKEYFTLTHSDNITPVNIDGLAFYENSLIAHQGSTLGGVFLYVLNTSQNHIIEKRAIEMLNPLFDFPTTGEVAGDMYYYIANAQLRKFNEDGSIYSLDRLDDVYILKANLSEIKSKSD